MSEGRSYTTAFGAYTKSFEEGIDRMNNALKEYQKELKNNKKEQTSTSREIKAYEKELKALEEEIKKSGEATEEQKKRQKELNDKISEAKQRLDDLKLAQAALKKEIEDTKNKIEEQKKAVETFKNSMSDAKDSAKELGAEIAGLAAAGTAALAGMIAYGRQASQWADDLNTLSKTTGIATSDLQKFQYAEKLVDVSTETLTGSLTKLTKNMADAAEDDTGKAAESFEKLNVKVTDSTGKIRDRQEVFYEIIDALGKVGNEVERDALAMNIFGKSAQQLNPLIKGGAQILKEVGNEAERAGLILSQEELDKLNQFNDKIDSLTAKGTQIQKITAGQVTPAVDGLLEVADELLDDIKQMADSGELKDLAESWGVTIRKGASDLKNLVLWVTKHKEAVAGAAGAMAGYKIGLSIGSLVNSLCAGMSALKAITDKETASQIALNTAMNSNPIGVVIGLVGALSGGLLAMSAASATAASEAEKLNSAVEKTLTAYSSSLAGAEAETTYISSLGEEYEKLRIKADLTAGEKEKLASLADILQTKLGLEAGEVKNTAGEYQELTDKIKDAVKAMKQEAQVSAAKAGLQAAYEEQIKAEEQYQLKLKEVREKYPALYDENGQLNRNEYNYDTQEAVKEVQELKQAYKNAAESVDFYNEKIKEAVSATEDEGNAQDELKKKTTQAGAAVKTALDEVDEYANHFLNGDSGYTLQGFYDLFTSVGDAADELQNRLTEANRKLEENRSSIRQTKDEILQLEKDLKNPQLNDVEYEKKFQQLTEARQKLSELKTEQVGLKKAVSDAEKAYKEAAWSAKTLNERLAEIGKTSASIRSEMNSLSNTFKDLQEGNKLSLDTLLSLSEKYPEYAAQILSATDNLNAQKDVVKLLYEVKKQELIKSLEAAKTEIELEQEKIRLKKEAVQATLKAAQAHYEHAEHTQKVADTIKELKNQIKELNEELDGGESKVDAYNNAIAKLVTLGMPVNNNNTNNNYTPAQTAASQSTQWEWEWLGEKGTGSTSSQARTQLVERVYNLGLITQQELQKEYEKILREEANTYEESYDLRLKLKNVTDRILAEEVKAKEEAEKKKEEAEKARLQALKREQELASAAYRKLVEGEISAIQDKNKTIQDGADAQIKAIDEEMEKRRQQKEDDSRKKELDAVNLQLKYFRGDETGRASLEQRRQEILNEQAEIEFERQMEQKKLDIQTQANSKIDSNTAAIDKLTAVMEDVAYRLASSHSAQEVVSRITDRTELIEMFKDARYMTDGQIQSFIQALKQETYSG